MKPVLFLAIFSFFAITVPAATAPATEPLPTTDQLREQLTQQKYQDVLRSVAKALALKGDAAKAYDRYALYCLRADAYLGTKANGMAAESFKLAAKETTDPLLQAAARGNELIVRRAKPGGYVPRTSQGDDTKRGAKGAIAPLPILTADDRKHALQVMLADEISTSEPKLKAGRLANTLPPIIEAVQAVNDLRAIEIACSGKDNQSKELAADLGTHAHQLISAELRSMSSQVEVIWSAASGRQYGDDSSGPQTNGEGMRGLTSAQSNKVRDIVNACAKLVPLTAEMAKVTGGVDLDADSAAALTLQNRADDILQYDYATAGRHNKKRATN